jgi:hypothetical protein
MGRHHFTPYLRSPSPRSAAAHPPTSGPHSTRLDDILTIVPRHLMAAPSYLQATVQRRVLDVLVQQIMGGR